MTPNDNLFQHDRLEEQLAVLAESESQEPTTPTSRAYSRLRQFHAAQAEQEAQAIERVRLRLAARAAHPQPQQEAQHEPSLSIVPRPLPLPTQRFRRISRLNAFLSTVAAVVVVGALVLGFAVLLHPGQGVGTPSFTNYAWQIVPSPNGPKPINALSGIAFSSSTDGWAVGTSSDVVTNGSPEYLPLIEHWDGKAWQVVATPALPYGGILNEVTSLTPDNAWAVGDMTYIPKTSNDDAYTSPLIEHWDGHQWTVVPNPALPPKTHANLASVAALSADDIWAVGNADNMNGLIEHWDGQQWSISPDPPAASSNQQAQLTNIAALAPDDVWVAGRGMRGFNHWDGHQWSIVASPVARTAATPFSKAVYFPGGISALSANDIWAAGFAATHDSAHGYMTTPEEIVLQHWDGHEWSIVDTPQPTLTNLFFIAETIAFGPANIWVIGSQTPPPFLDSPVSQGFIAHWDGQRWSVISNPHPHKCVELMGATADPTTPGNLWMVGSAGSQCREYDSLSDSTFIETSK